LLQALIQDHKGYGTTGATRRKLMEKGIRYLEEEITEIHKKKKDLMNNLKEFRKECQGEREIVIDKGQEYIQLEVGDERFTALCTYMKRMHGCEPEDIGVTLYKKEEERRVYTQWIKRDRKERMEKVQRALVSKTMKRAVELMNERQQPDKVRKWTIMLTKEQGHIMEKRSMECHRDRLKSTVTQWKRELELELSREAEIKQEGAQRCEVKRTVIQQEDRTRKRGDSVEMAIHNGMQQQNHGMRKQGSITNIDICAAYRTWQ
jgi:hypothetical protein